MNGSNYSGPKIENARKKYGPENFEYKVLMKVTGDNEEEVKLHNQITEEVQEYLKDDSPIHLETINNIFNAIFNG